MSSESNHDYRVKMNVIDYITITCNLKNGRLQITSDYMKKCNRLQLITITNYDYPMSGRSPIQLRERHQQQMKISSDLGNRHPVTIDQHVMPAIELLEG